MKMEKKNNEKIIIIKGTNQEVEIPVEGSLGLLALGAVGLEAWRAKREQVKKEFEAKQNGQKNR